MKIKITSPERLYPEQTDYVLIQMGKVAARIQLPLGHDVNDCIIETSKGDGWEIAKIEKK